MDSVNGRRSSRAIGSILALCLLSAASVGARVYQDKAANAWAEPPASDRRIVECPVLDVADEADQPADAEDLQGDALPSPSLRLSI